MRRECSSLFDAGAMIGAEQTRDAPSRQCALLRDMRFALNIPEAQRHARGRERVLLCQHDTSRYGAKSGAR